MITLKFNRRIAELPKGQSLLNIKTVSNTTGKSILNELKKNFGEFSIEKAYPTSIWGDTLRIHKRTKEIIKVKDFSQVYKIKFAKLVDLKNVITFLSKYKIIEYVDPPLVGTLCTTTINDSEFVSGNQWKLPFLQAQEAWDVTTGSASTKIVISDFFYNYQNYTQYHEDLQNRVDINAVGNNYGSHGACVAGMAASNTNNGIGIAGMDWNARLIFASSLSQTFYNAVNIWDADIINCSWISYASATLRDAVEYALLNGVIITAGIGNDQKNMGQFRPIPNVTYPAAYNFQNGLQVIASTAYGFNGQIFFPPDPNNQTGYWNYSPGTDPINNPNSAFVDFCAPGYDIRMYDYYDWDDYWFGRGTSFSAPVIAGIVGLMLSVDNTLTPTEVYNILRETADKIGEFSYDAYGWNQYYGWGGVNAYRAVSAVEPPDTPTNFNLTTATFGSKRPKLTWSKSTAVDVTGYKVDRRIDGGSWHTPTLAQNLGPNDTEFIDMEIIIMGATSKTAEYRLRSLDYAGLSSGWTDILSIDFTIMLDETETSSFSEIVEKYPSKFSLGNNYPNPFNPSTTIPVGIKKKSLLRVDIYNALGQKTKSLTNDYFGRGYHNLTWNGTDDFGNNVSSGVYFLLMTAQPIDGDPVFLEKKVITLLK